MIYFSLISSMSINLIFLLIFSIDLGWKTETQRETQLTIFLSMQKPRINNKWNGSLKTRGRLQLFVSRRRVYLMKKLICKHLYSGFGFKKSQAKFLNRITNIYVTAARCYRIPRLEHGYTRNTRWQRNFLIARYKRRYIWEKNRASSALPIRYI